MMLDLSSCPKKYVTDQDKAVSPVETINNVRAQLSHMDISVLGRVERIDQGRLDIPVFLSVCGADAKKIMPTRKQMGKGASAEQAEASAVMELMERFGFFSYFERMADAFCGTWTEAEKRFQGQLIPLEEITFACHDTLPIDAARCIMDLRRWMFVPATQIQNGQKTYLPIDLFRQLGEFNGSSAGNTDVESILQGTSELIERHVCAIIDKTRQTTPTIDLATAAFKDPVLKKLIGSFEKNGITLILKDFSLGMPLPTIGALAIDPSTFPETSEIVFTAGTATTPVKAAIRAITEIAQLAGDFCSAACYEASGLPKFLAWEETAWLQKGKITDLDSLPNIESDDILEELLQTAQILATQGYTLYSIATTHPETKIPSHYNIIPGFHFRERDRNARLGLFVGRILSEREDAEKALLGLQEIEKFYPNGHFIPFYHGLIAMRQSNLELARLFFAKAAPLQPDSDAKALTSFYHGYTLTLENKWAEALPYLDDAANLCPEMKEYLNLRGVCHFKLQKYQKAATDFTYILTHLDKGSVLDIQNLGVCYKHLGETAQAKRYLSAALSIDPSLEGARKHLADLN